MKAHFLMTHSASVAAAVLLGAAPMAFAQAPILIGQPARVAGVGNVRGTQLFEWTGRVDREVQVVMQNNRVWTNKVGATEPNGAQGRAFSRIPNENGMVAVQVLDGRGDVQVIQQPSRANNYTAIVRIQDSKSGEGSYHIAGYWQGTSGDVYGREDRHDNGGYRDRNDHNDGRNGGWDNNRGGINGRNNERSVMHFSGNVDADVELRIQNGHVDVRRLSGQQPTNVRANARAIGGQMNNNLTVAMSQGRGQVVITQQPRAQNGYTTVVRIRDSQGGYGYYDFDIVER